MLVATLASFLYFFGVDDAARQHLLTNPAAARRRSGSAPAGPGGKASACRLTPMPQMVANLYNGMGGGAAAAIAAVELLRNADHALVSNT